MGGPNARGAKRGKSDGIWLKKVEHVFGRLLKVSFLGEAWEGNFFGEEINGENVSFGIGVWEITLPATVVRKGRANIPTNLTVLAKRSTIVVRNVGNDASTTRSKGGPIKIEMAKEGGVCGKRRMNTGRSQ